MKRLCARQLSRALLLGFLLTSSNAYGSAQDLFGYGSYCPGVANACLTQMGLMESVSTTPLASVV